MKYVALLSGGKDSCFNLLHCHINGHQLVAAASLRPPDGLEEIDSYMYQTVGQDAIQLVADALNVPLYRRGISGIAVETGLLYGSRSHDGPQFVHGDETEDLFALLTVVKQKHPDVEGVSVGAILSNYQRLRVEHVCARLSLTALCYLWQRNQGDLLSEMIAANLNAIILKVAGIGLVAEHVGMTLLQLQPVLLKLNELYGSHICGEGGEFETLTLDCPMFQKRLNLVETELVTHSESSFASVYYLRVRTANLQARPPLQLKVVPPPLLDAFPKTICEVLSTITPNTIRENGHPTGTHYNSGSLDRLQGTVQFIRRGDWLCVGNLCQSDGRSNSVESQLDYCFDSASDILAQNESGMKDIAMINLFISSMGLFQRVNTAYAKRFGVAPPARACVAIDLPPGVHVRLEVIAYLCGSRKSMHVQSLSYWAPANIGPYSQAVTVGSQSFVSGQIGLVPASNLLPNPPCMAMEFSLGIQHLLRIRATLGQESVPPVAPLVQACIVWLTEEPHFDALSNIWTLPTKTDECASMFASPAIFLLAKELPKGAMVEYQVILHAASVQIPDPEDEAVITTKPTTLSFDKGQCNLQTSGSLLWEIGTCAQTSSIVSIAFFNVTSQSHDSSIKALPIAQALKSPLSIRLFFTADFSPCFQLLSLIFETPNLPTTFVPVGKICDRNGKSWPYAICILSNK